MVLTLGKERISMKYARVLVMLGMLALLMQASASAQTFTSSSASVVTSGTDTGDLLLSWTETGLVPGSSVTYTLSADVSVTYACVANNTGTPQAPVTMNDVNKSGTLTASRKGTISQKGILPVPAPQQACPSGQNLVLWQVDWTNAQIMDDTNGGLTAVASASASVTFCDLNKNPNKCP